MALSPAHMLSLAPTPRNLAQSRLTAPKVREGLLPYLESREGGLHGTTGFQQRSSMSVSAVFSADLMVSLYLAFTVVHIFA